MSKIEPEAALRELLRLYDQRKDLLTYGWEKKAAWEVARKALDGNETP